MFCTDGWAISKQAEIDAAEHLLSMEPKVMPDEFCEIFPFHLMFSRDLVIFQAGTTISRIIPALKSLNCKLTDIFTLFRPHMDFTFHSISSHVNTVYVLLTNDGILAPPTRGHVTTPLMTSPLRLKGEMIYVPEFDSIMFICSPSLMNLDELNRRGLYLR